MNANIINRCYFRQMFDNKYSFAIIRIIIIKKRHIRLQFFLNIVISISTGSKQKDTPTSPSSAGLGARALTVPVKLGLNIN